MVNFLKFRAVWMLVCLVSVTAGIAQNFSQHNWYFGNSVQGIRFSRNDNSATLVNNQFTPFGTGGSAVATDPNNANLIFYTDGANVFDLSHKQMPAGSGLNANTAANQPVAICPVPGQPSQYYIFTNSAAGSIFTTIVDLSLAGTESFPNPPLGNVVAASINTPTALTGRSEAMILVPNANGTDFWLITHQSGTDDYFATSIDASGTMPTTPSPSVTGFPITAANFSYHAGTGKIAVSPKTADRNVAILNFDNATGAITLDQFVLNSAVPSTIGQSIYDTEWSNSGRYLYISRHGEAGIPADVVQYDIANPAVSLATVLSFVPDRSYGLQMAPDSSIYHLYQATPGGPFLVGRLTNTDTVSTSVADSTSFFGLGIDFKGTQFPAFSPRSTSNLAVTFITSGGCSSSPVSFYPFVAPTADSLVWDFGDSQTSNQWSPIHTYQAGGVYNVEVIAYLNGDTASYDLDVTLTQFDLQLTLVQDTTACKCELPVHNGIPPCPNDTSDDFSVTVKTQGGSPISYTWSNGDTGTTLTPDSAGYYYVVVADASGCTGYAGVNVREYDAVDQRANIWYFGQNAGIDFNAPITAIAGPLDTPEGCSVISDRNGAVVFSTDGVHVYDRNDTEIILAAPGLGGEQGSTQAALIIPVPNDETLYYIFTTQEVQGAYTYELRYSLYDIKMNGGNGGIVQYNRLLFTRSTERITGNANWLIAHEYGNNSFRAYPITATGIGNPVVSSIGSDHLITDQINGRGYMKLGLQNRLAVALSSFNTPLYTNILEIFDFDNTTGAVTNFHSINLNSTKGQVYGIEFSGNKLFATLLGSPSYLREIYFDFQGNPVLIPPLTPQSAEELPFELGAIQTGPDGQIYIAENNKGFLGTIQVNPDTLLRSNFVPDYFPLTGNSQLGLPNFVQSIGTGPQLASMTVAGLCLGDSTLFTGTGTDAIDEFAWSFGDGFGSTAQVSQHEYAAAGTYLVSLRVTNRCGLDTTITQSVTIVPPPANPTFLPIGQQPVLCTGTLTLEAEPAPPSSGYTYLWSMGDTTRSIIVSRQSIVSVVITNAQGCTSNGAILVADNRPQVDLGPDQTLCQNTPVSPLNAQNPGTTYEWFIDDVLIANTAQTQPVNTALAGPPPVKYEVHVTDAVTTCVAKDSVVFTINASPAFSAIPANTSGCGVNDGQIALTINSPASTLFSYLVVGAVKGTTFQDIDQPVGPVLPVFTLLPADTYIVQVSDQVSGCASFTSVGISNNVIAITGAVAQSPTCDPVAINVQTTGILAGSFPAKYTIINSATGVIEVPPTDFFTANFPTVPVPVPGNYTIQINAQNCVATFNLNIVSDPVTTVSFVPDLCNAKIMAQPAGAVSYTWSTSPIGGIGAGGTTATATIIPGTWDVQVIVDDGVNCPGTGNITVTVETPANPAITQSDACEDLVTLSATPTGSYTYQWQNVTDVTTINGGSSIIVSTTDNLDFFTVTVRSTLTGCTYASPPKQIFVAGDLQLAIATTLPCTGNSFTLTGSSNIVGTNFQWGFDGTDISGETQTTLIDQTQSGLYRLTGILPGCTESIEQSIILFPSTAGSLPNRALICNDPANPDPDSREILLDAGAGFLSYEWYQNEVLSSNTSQTFLAVEPALYRVELINTFGCSSTDQTNVEKECNPRIVAPTAFRPGSTIAENSTFYVFTYFVESADFQMFIYNRWGELIYQSSGLDLPNRSKQWNGGYNNNINQLLPAGTYSYIVKYKSSYRPEDGIQEKRGGVVLLR